MSKIVGHKLVVEYFVYYSYVSQAWIRVMRAISYELHATKGWRKAGRVVRKEETSKRKPRDWKTESTEIWKKAS